MSVRVLVLKLFGSAALLTITMVPIAFGNGSGRFPFGWPARSERCSQLGTRTRQFSVTCCGVTHTVWKSSSKVRNAMIPTSQTHPGVRHYEYVFPDGYIYVYDLDNHFALVKHFSMPTSAGVKGAVASAATGTLYISYGSDKRGGSMLAYNLRSDKVMWHRNYSFGIDSMSISPDGGTIYMPTGELALGGLWKVLDARSGNVIASIDSGGTGPHNTVVNSNGSHVYLGPRYSNYLIVASSRDNDVLRQIGPVQNGVRPFTINAKETLAYITTSGFLGFHVADINTGKIIYTVPVRGFKASGGAATCPSHGISLSPGEKEIYLIDSINNYVHVFDVSGGGSSMPAQVANIPLRGPLSGDESGCAYDCLKDGWIHHSRNGRYVFVGDSGDVIDTKIRTTVATLPAMANARKEIEIDFQNNSPVWAMISRSSVGMR
jgi:DNA-binding beta-propeller fold protein YncE